MPLPTNGVCSYNGVSFGTYTRSRVQSRPVYDAAGRAVSHVVHTLTVATTLYAQDGFGVPNADSGGTVEAQMVLVRRLLTAPGGALVYQNKGFGDLVVNVGSVRDVVWGPRPQLLGWRPLGGQAAVEVEWVCEVAIPECGAAVYSGALMEYTYEVAFSKDRSGYSTRTITGHLRIPLTRLSAGSRAVVDQADAYRNQIKFPPFTNFRRTAEDFRLSADRSTLTFSITDEEMPPNIPPVGVVEVSASHHVSSAGNNLSQFTGTLSATYELDRTADKGLAWAAFKALAQDRLQAAIDNANYTVNGQQLTGFAIITGLEMGEPEIYGRKCADFSLTYLLTTGLQSLIAASGLWRPVPGTDWQTWATSLQSSIFDPNHRGNSQLGYYSGYDAIVDLCAPVSPTAPGAAMTTNPPPPSSAELSTPCPPPESSWIAYHCSARIDQDSGVAVMRTLPLSTSGIKPDPTGVDFTNDPGMVSSTGGYQTQYQQGGWDNPVQYQSSPAMHVTLEGYAVRACYEIPAPNLAAVNAVQCVPDNVEDEHYFIQAVIASFGMPVYAARWRLRWVIPRPPVGKINVPSDPTMSNQ